MSGSGQVCRCRPDPIPLAPRGGTNFGQNLLLQRQAAGGKRPAPGGQPALVFVGAGRRAGIRPADLVGAIANEAGVEARRIGSIEISDSYSLVEVPQEAAEPVIEALRATTLRGRKVTVKRTRK